MEHIPLSLSGWEGGGGAANNNIHLLYLITGSVMVTTPTVMVDLFGAPSAPKAQGLVQTATGFVDLIALPFTGRPKNYYVNINSFITCIVCMYIAYSM